MRWQGREQSENVRDQRGASPGRMVAGGGIGMLLIAFVAMLFGKNPQALLEANKKAQAKQGQAGEVGKDDQYKAFVGSVLKTTEDIWTKQFADHGQRYKKPIVNLFTAQVQSGCGPASSAMGPFYCPADNQVYIDPTFFEELAEKYGAPGDFACAFVIAHEVAHHVQNELRWNDQANKARRSGNKLASNRESVRLELQADFLAGVWAHHAHKQFNILEEGDLGEAMQAAIQIGDDTLQAKATGRVVPENFTHGSAEQRKRWFLKGVQSGSFPDAQRLLAMPYEEL
ncbi:MAG: neutral zinc metallopeptidase [Planctomycetaceae bacterium]